MDISLNLARIGNFAADDYQGKIALIKLFLAQTQNYLEELNGFYLPSGVKEPVEKFNREFSVIKEQKVSKNGTEAWAEKVLTWANILQHRSSLA